MRTKTILLACLLMTAACRKKEPPPSQDPSALQMQSTDSTSQIPKAARVSIPDEGTYFPLLEGSYWIYESVQEGERIPEDRVIDSIVRVESTPDGYLADVASKSASGEIFHIHYRVDGKGDVNEKRGLAKIFHPYTMLSPAPGMKVGKYTFRTGCQGETPPERDCVFMEPYNLREDLAEDSMSMWNGITFKKGIGKTEHAGYELTQVLIEYRIGDGPIVKLHEGSKE